MIEDIQNENKAKFGKKNFSDSYSQPTLPPGSQNLDTTSGVPAMERRVSAANPTPAPNQKAVQNVQTSYKTQSSY